jgi:hypothetical protein
VYRVLCGVGARRIWGGVTTELEALRAKLEELKGAAVVDITEMRRVTDRMDELLSREEMMWLQRPV